MTAVTRDQVLAWRMRQQFLDRPTGASAVDITRRLCGVQAQVASNAETAIMIRQRRPRRGELDHALRVDRTLVKIWSMRGTLHLLPRRLAATCCAALASARWWERESYLRGFGITRAEQEAILETIAEVLPGRVLTRGEVVEAILGRSGSAHLAESLRSGWGALLKPAAFLGLLCHGPANGSRVTFTSPATWLPEWALPDPDEAGRELVRSFLHAHGPATAAVFGQWLFRNIKPGLPRRWFASVRDELAEIAVDGSPQFVLADDLDDLIAMNATREVRLLGGFDQYVLAADRSLIPEQHKSKVSRTAGWISPVVVYGGRIAGVWELRDGREVVPELFEDVPAAALEREIDRILALLGRAA